MSLRLKNSAFLHIPKCGGEWIDSVLRGEKIVATLPEQSPEYITGSQHCLVDGIPSFCFVRHPISWYASYWRFKTQQEKWNPYNYFDLRVRSDNFRLFVQKVLINYPQGYLSQILYPFFTTECEVVGRLENIRHDLIVALKHFGEDFSTRKILESPPTNVSHKGLKAAWTPDLYRRILEAEKDAIKRYYDPVSV